MSVSYGRRVVLSIKSALIFFVRLFFKLYFGAVGKPKINKNLKKVLSLYKKRGFLADFSLIRIWDAPFEKLEKISPRKGDVLDLGCGDGILSNYLAVSSAERSVTGIELNKNRIKEADRGLKNAKFVQGNILEKEFPKSDAVFLTHVLHHLASYEDQEKLLVKCGNDLKKNGKLIVTEIIERPFLKFLFSALTDIIIVPILFDGKIIDAKIHYRTLSSWKKLFIKLGFKFKYEIIHKGMPFSHVIFVLETGRRNPR